MDAVLIGRRGLIMRLDGKNLLEEFVGGKIAPRANQLVGLAKPVVDLKPLGAFKRRLS